MLFGFVGMDAWGATWPKYRSFWDLIFPRSNLDWLTCSRTTSFETCSTYEILIGLYVLSWKSFAFHKLVWWHFQVVLASGLQFVFFWDDVNNQKYNTVENDCCTGCVGVKETRQCRQLRRRQNVRSRSCQSNSQQPRDYVSTAHAPKCHRTTGAELISLAEVDVKIARSATSPNIPPSTTSPPLPGIHNLNQFHG